ncbi:DUF1145 domain-containing protein [Ferrimonas balearica]|uniref:DUF1145 domain-containing protein n=1 Tax=Ferrimonas balearica TaxID=44012 RepID=UPI001C9914E5|nr:DUF1145 domain-containing protein [Ferrimonas balearica]MBY5993406.1 DUF1145 domain-containing protein [Ferrimonas balearica]
MNQFLSWAKAAVAAGWLIMIVNLIFPWPHPYNLALHILLQITLAGHLAICAGVRVRQGKPLSWDHYKEMMLYGVFALLSWRQAAKSQEKE